MAKPLNGHPFHNKSDAELTYILRDAAEAAYAMRHHDPAAEAQMPLPLPGIERMETRHQPRHFRHRVADQNEEDARHHE